MNEPRRIQAYAEAKSLEELAYEAAGGDKGIRCPKCNCPDWRVVRTRDGSGVIKRKRVCRNPNCSYEIHTTEKPNGVPQRESA